jgi:hypothetical protein
MKTWHWVAIAVVAAGITALIFKRKIEVWFAQRTAAYKVAVENAATQAYVKDKIAGLIGGRLD